MYKEKTLEVLSRHSETYKKLYDYAFEFKLDCSRLLQLYQSENLSDDKESLLIEFFQRIFFSTIDHDLMHR